MENSDLDLFPMKSWVVWNEYNVGVEGVSICFLGCCGWVCSSLLTCQLQPSVCRPSAVSLHHPHPHSSFISCPSCIFLLPPTRSSNYWQPISCSCPSTLSVTCSLFRLFVSFGRKTSVLSLSLSVVEDSGMCFTCLCVLVWSVISSAVPWCCRGDWGLQMYVTS